MRQSIKVDCTVRRTEPDIRTFYGGDRFGLTYGSREVVLVFLGSAPILIDSKTGVALSNDPVMYLSVLFKARVLDYLGNKKKISFVKEKEQEE